MQKIYYNYSWIYFHNGILRSLVSNNIFKPLLSAKLFQLNRKFDEKTNL